MKNKYIVWSLFVLVVVFVFFVYVVSANRLRSLTSIDISDNPQTDIAKLQSKESSETGFEQVKPIKVSGRQYKIAFLGDQGLASTSKQVMELLKSEKVDLMVQLGDFDYEDNPNKWRNLITDVLGGDVAVLPVMGNHDVKNWDGYKVVVNNFVNNTKESFKGMNCAGDIGRDYSCKDENFHFVFVSPGMTNIKHEDFIKSQFATSTALWRVCVWHYNQEKMQIGGKKDEAGWEAYEACREAGAMIFTAHDHNYGRTHLLSAVEETEIATTSDVMLMKPGVTFVTVAGLGGKSVRGQVRNDPWWASIYTSKQKANAGAVICTFGVGIKDIYADVQDYDLGKAGCYFRDIKGFVPDAYYLESGFGGKTN